LFCSVEDLKIEDRTEPPQSKMAGVCSILKSHHSEADNYEAPSGAFKFSLIDQSLAQQRRPTVRVSDEHEC
jgi:hypothetical protein